MLPIVLTNITAIGTSTSYGARCSIRKRLDQRDEFRALKSEASANHVTFSETHPCARW